MISVAMYPELKRDVPTKNPAQGMLTGALFPIPKPASDHRCPSRGAWVRKLGSIEMSDEAMKTYGGTLNAYSRGKERGLKRLRSAVILIVERSSKNSLGDTGRQPPVWIPFCKQSGTWVLGLFLLLCVLELSLPPSQSPGLGDRTLRSERFLGDHGVPTPRLARTRGSAQSLDWLASKGSAGPKGSRPGGTETRPQFARYAGLCVRASAGR